MVLWLVMFYDALIMLALPSTSTYIAGSDGGVSRLICYCAAAFLIVYVLYKFGFKQLPIVWMGALLVFVIFSSLHTPNINFASTFMPRDSGIFNFKPMFECILMFGLFMSIYSYPLSMVDSERIYKTLGYIGVFISIYIFCQKLGMDQAYRLTDEISLDHMSRNPTIGGFISQPVYASAVVVILLPFMLRLNGWFAFLGTTAVICTGNRSGIIAMLIIGLYFITDSKMVAQRIFVAYMVILALVVAVYWVHPKMFGHIQSSGRLEAWKLIIQDFINPKFPGIDKSYVLTGQGIGAFSTFFPFYNNSSFDQAHNEYLELWRGTSFIGLFLFFRTQFAIFHQIRNRLIFSSLLGISILACTNPVWHIATLAFLTAFLCGLGLNRLERA